MGNVSHAEDSSQACAVTVLRLLLKPPPELRAGSVLLTLIWPEEATISK